MHAGIWLKDEQASDMKAYQRSLTHCMRMSGLEKETATRLFEGMQIQHDHEGISVQYLTVVPFFKVTDRWEHCQIKRVSGLAVKNQCCELVESMGQFDNSYLCMAQCNLQAVA